MHTALVDMFLLFAYHFRALEVRSRTVVNMSSVRGAVLYYYGGGVRFCCGGVCFFGKKNVQEYYSYVAARGGWRTGADHELESCPIGLMHCGHFFCSVRPLFLSDKASTHNAVQRPPAFSYYLKCFCLINKMVLNLGLNRSSNVVPVGPHEIKQTNDLDIREGATSTWSLT